MTARDPRPRGCPKDVPLLVDPGNAGARLRPESDAVDDEAARSAVEHDDGSAAVPGEGGKVS